MEEGTSMDQNVITKENRSQFILENANDLIAILNERLEYEYINVMAHRKLMGYTSQDLIGKTSLNLIHPDDYEKAVKEWREGFTQGEGAAELRLKDKAGNYHWLEIRGRTFVDTDGKKKGLVISRDITKRKEAELKLKESEQNLQERIKELQFLYGISKLDEKPEISINEIIQGTLDLIPPAWQFPELTCSRIRFKNNEYKTINFKETKWKSFTSVNINEKIMNIEVYYLEDKPFLKEESKLMEEIGIRLKAIIEHREVEQKLKESEKKYRNERDNLTNVLNSMEDGVYIINQQYEIEYLNPALEKHFGPVGNKKCYEYFQERFDICPWCNTESVLEGNPIRWERYSPITQKTYDITETIIKNPDENLSKLVIFHNITERKKAEEEIVNLAKFPSENPNPILRVTKEKVIYVNKSAESLFNIREGSNIPPLIQDRVNMALDINTAKTMEIELNNCIYSIDITPIKGEEYANVYGKNITERKKAENMLKESEEKYRNERDNLTNILNSMEDGVYIVNQQYDIEFVNLLLIEEFGPYEGKKCYKYLHDRFEVCPWCKNQDVFEGKTVRWEWYSSKNQKTYDLIDTPLKNPDGSLSKLEIFHDITERKKIEEEINNAYSKLNQIFKVTYPLCIIDKDFNIIRINDTFTTTFNIKKDDLFGKKCYDIIPGPFCNTLECTMRQILGGIDSREYEKTIEHSNGIKDTYIMRAVPYLGKGGEIIGIFKSYMDITARKKAVQKLKESEEKYRLIAENANDLIAVLNEKFEYEYINELVYMKILGYSYEDLLGKSLSNFIHPHDLEKAFKSMKKCSEIGECEEELRFKNKKGDYLWLEVRGKAFIDGDGEKKALLISREVTERKLAEEKLRESEKKYKNLAKELEIILDHLPGLVFYKDTENNFIRVNKFLADAHNMAKEELIGKNLFELYPKEEAQAYWDDDLEVIRSCNPKLNIEEPWDTIEGRKWVSTSKIPFVDENGKIIGIVGFSRDITERKKAELLLKESEEKFRKITEQSLMGIAILQDDVFKYVNQRYGAIHGYTIEELNNFQPEEFIKLVHPKDRDMVMEQAKKKQKGLEDVINNYQFRGIKKTGETRWIEILSKTMFYEGRPADLITIIDITEKKKAEEELKRLNKLKSELLTRSSHELKTPLMHIKGFTELLLLKYKESFYEDELYLVNEIRKGCFRLEILVEDILKTAELESGTIQLEKSEEDLSLIIETCVRELKGFADSRNQNINLMLHDKLITSLERKQISQAINNLLNNAIKYTPPNGNIEICSEIKEDFFIISIKDSGIGFNEEEKRRIFKRFGKIERYGQGYDVVSDGSGLGLYISKKIIELHGGKIWVESEGKSKGSTFYFSLPIMTK